MNYFDDDRTGLPPLIPLKVARKRQNSIDEGSKIVESLANLVESKPEEKHEPEER